MTKNGTRIKAIVMWEKSRGRDGLGKGKSTSFASDEGLKLRGVRAFSPCVLTSFSCLNRLKPTAALDEYFAYLVYLFLAVSDFFSPN